MSAAEKAKLQHAMACQAAVKLEIRSYGKPLAVVSLGVLAFMCDSASRQTV